MDQIDLIEKIAKSLPCGYKLYVKEHVRNHSKRPSGFHKKISEFPNVRLISPKAATIEIIKKSSLVCTITGTVGWEAVLLGIPVLVFGEVFYAYFDQVTIVTDSSLLPQIIQEKIDQEIPSERAEEAVAAMLAGTFEGIAALPADCQNRSLGKENLDKLVFGVEEYINRMFSE